MRENPKVSIIVPVWNPCPGISRCVETLRGQTFEDIEMIFVDDCGTDGAMDVVRAAAKEDTRIRILENLENFGPGISRNIGIEVARGEYLAFIDADDYVNPVFLERLYSKAVAEELDIVKGKIVYEKEDGSVVKRFELNDMIRKSLKSGEPLFYLFSFQHQSAIYRRDFLMKYDIRYGTSRRGQDDTFLLKACHKADRFDFEETAEYHFCERSNSLMHDVHPRTFEKRLHALREQMDYIVGSMASEKYISQRIARSVNYELMLCIHYRQRPECLDAAGDFISGLRDQVLRFPQLDKLKRESFVVRVLCDYGVALAQRPFKLPWEKYKVENYLGTVSIWVDFVVEHPDCMNDAETDLYRLFREAFMLWKKENCSDGIKRSLITQTNRLPFRQRIHIFEDNQLFAFSVKMKIRQIKKGVSTFLKKRGSSK